MSTRSRPDSPGPQIAVPRHDSEPRTGGLAGLLCGRGTRPTFHIHNVRAEDLAPLAETSSTGRDTPGEPNPSPALDSERAPPHPTVGAQARATAASAPARTGQEPKAHRLRQPPTNQTCTATAARQSCAAPPPPCRAAHRYPCSPSDGARRGPGLGLARKSPGPGAGPRTSGAWGRSTLLFEQSILMKRGTRCTD